MTANTLPTGTPATSATPARGRTGRRHRPSALTTAVLAAASLAVLIPLLVTVSMAFKTTAQAVDGNAFSLPNPVSTAGLVEAWVLTNFPRGFAVSLFVSTVTVVGVITLSAMASYAISRNWERRLFRYAFFYLLGAMFLPFPVLALSQVKLTGMVGLDNPVGVAILHVMFQLSFSTLLFTAFLRSIPGELEESARLDGATTWQAFWNLIFPLLAPMSATVGILAFLHSWNDFMMPSLITSEPAWQTLPVLQNIFQDQFSNNYNVAFGSYLMSMAPAIVVYLFTQRWVMSGVTQGAIK